MAIREPLEVNIMLMSSQPLPFQRTWCMQSIVLEHLRPSLNRFQKVWFQGSIPGIILATFGCSPHLRKHIQVSPLGGYLQNPNRYFPSRSVRTNVKCSSESLGEGREESHWGRGGKRVTGGGKGRESLGEGREESHWGREGKRDTGGGRRESYRRGEGQELQFSESLG